MTYELITTADGSSTLAHPKTHEKMHHEAGAWSETLEVYGHPAAKFLDQGFVPRFLVLGLGLGYIEIVLMALVLSRSQEGEFFLHTFESDSFLRNSFIDWLSTKQSTSPLFSAYEDILKMAASEFTVEETRLKKTLQKLFQEKRLIVSGELTLNETLEVQFRGVFFDAYSKISNEQLWTEKFLSAFLEKFAAPESFFLSYAANTILKRSLQKNGFEITAAQGFAKKRERTVAKKQHAQCSTSFLT